MSERHVVFIVFYDSVKDKWSPEEYFPTYEAAEDFIFRSKATRSPRCIKKIYTFKNSFEYKMSQQAVRYE